MENPTRREFVKSALLGASATLAAGASGAGHRPDAPAATRGTCPPCPYGTGEPIYLADFDRCQPQAALAPDFVPKRWRLVPYQTDRLKGTMLVAATTSPVPVVEYPLSQRGWHAIHFGIFSLYHESRLQVRLKGESSVCLLTPNDLVKENSDWNDIQYVRHTYDTFDPEHRLAVEEVFWKCARLDEANASLLLGQLQVQTVPGHPEIAGNAFAPLWLAYVKLVPLSAEESAEIEKDRMRRDRRRVFIHDDAFDAPCFLHFKTEGDIRREVEPYRESDVGRVYWEAAMGDLTHYPSKLGRLMTLDWMRGQYYTEDRLIGEVHRDFQAKGIDPFRVALDSCHALGIEFHGCYRVSGFLFPPPEDGWNDGGVYARHPEWRGRDRQGAEMPRLSYAYPDARNFVCSMLEEIAAYPVDGICLLYNRRLPVMGYEAPLVASFQAKHGIDPRSLPADDPRWRAHSAEELNGFMREVRRRMRQTEQKRGGKPIGITAVVMGSREEDYGNGLDAGAWAREGLIDTLVGYAENRRAAVNRDSAVAKYLLDAVRGTSCQTAVNLMPRYLSPENYKRRADALYRAGIDHIFLWDSHKRINYDSGWDAIRRLGHREELAAWRARGEPVEPRQIHALTRLGNWNMSYGSPG